MAIQMAAKMGEGKMMDTLGAIRDRAGWRAIHFHLDKLNSQYKNEYQIKIAMNLVHDLLKNEEGGVYLLTDNSLVVLTHKIDKAMIGKLIFQLRYLYMDDLLAYTEAGQENQDFCTQYDLSREWDAFFAFATQRMGGLVRSAPVAKSAEIIKPSPVARGGLTLETLDADLQKVNLAKAIRRQPVCALLPGGGIRRVFDELYVHIAQLRKDLQEDSVFFQNRWLFKYVTGLLDSRMLELIRKDAAYLATPVSLNLNADTLLSSRFAEFDAALPDAAKVSIVIEIPVLDVFADMAAFMAARSEVQKLGYRVCLDGLSMESFSTIDRHLLGLDLLKVQWNADSGGGKSDPRMNELRKAVQTVGSNRIILCRCDDRSAIEYGQSLGISLFQGRHLDGLLNPKATMQN